MHTARDIAPFPSAPLLRTLADNWWLVMLRGVVAILFGVSAFIWPGLTLAALVLLYGVYAVADGIFTLIAAFMERDRNTPTWWLVGVGLLSVAAGLIALFWPGITAGVLVVLIGLWALVHGVLEIVGAIQLRKEITDEWMLLAAGLISVIFGLLLLLSPGVGALAIVWSIGAYAMALGVMLVLLSWRLRHISQRDAGSLRRGERT
jgi:uncharacterized membrane protein HdeD (DUF308 family)